MTKIAETKLTVAEELAQSIARVQETAETATARAEALETLSELSAHDDWDNIARHIAQDPPIGGKRILNTIEFQNAHAFLTQLVKHIAPDADNIQIDKLHDVYFTVGDITARFKFSTNTFRFGVKGLSSYSYAIPRHLAELERERLDADTIYKNWKELHDAGLITNELLFAGDKSNAKQTRKWFSLTIPSAWDNQSIRRKLNPTLVWQRKPRYDEYGNDIRDFAISVNALAGCVDEYSDEKIGVYAETIKKIADKLLDYGFTAKVHDTELAAGASIDDIMSAIRDESVMANIKKANAKLAQVGDWKLVTRYREATSDTDGS